MRAAKLLACVAAPVALGLAAFLAWPAALPAVTPSAAQPTGAALVARGAYLTQAADCAACHTAPGGQAFAGGRAFHLPFGTIYAPNITPDTQTGIGAWSDAAFVRAVHSGIGRHGENLYPAFPYTAYARTTTDDVLAIRAYLATVPPVSAKSPPNRVAFPFNQRYGLRLWNALFLPSATFQANPTRDAAWNRGAYLADALGHCGECHTPRNALMGLDEARKYAGAVQVGWLAYNLTGDAAHGLGGWSDMQLQQYLATGQAAGRGPASGPMAEVVENSLRHLTPADISAMVHYLRGVPARSDGPATAGTEPQAAATDAAGRRLFVEACAGCHLPGGDGRQSKWAALKGAHTAADPTATNLLQILAHGSQMQTGEGLMFMHGFIAAYNDDEIAALANYTTSQFGNGPGHVTAKDVRKLRARSSDAAKS